MLHTTLAEIKAHPTRLLGVLLAVGLSVGFVVSCLVFIDTEAAAMKRSVSVRTAGSDVVVTPSDDRDLTEVISKTPGVETVEISRTTWLNASTGDDSGMLEVTSLPRDARLRWMVLEHGSWPERGDEIALGSRTAERAKASVGSTVRIRVDDRVHDLRVVGLLDESASLFSDLSRMGVVAPSSPVLHDASVDYLVIGSTGEDPASLAHTLQQRLPADTGVITSADLAAQRLDGLTGGIDAIRYLLLGFGSIAALVGSMIIANVFGIVVAQRRRQIGLLRAVGATRQQIRRALLGEAVLTGLVGSLLGLLLGVGIAAIGAAVSGSLAAGLTLRPAPLALAVLGGVLITLLAALAPARRAMVVSPLDALRPVADHATAHRMSRVRTTLAGVLGILGIGTITVALARGGSGTLVLAVGGAALISVAVIAAAPIFLAPVFRFAAWAVRGRRPSVRLAAANTVRNPARAAAVCSALMIGVGLIVTLQVGAASVQRSTEASVRHEFPVDAIVRATSGSLPADVLPQLRGLADVRAAIAVPSVTASVGHDSVRLDGLGADAGSVVAAGLDELDSGTALAHPFTLEMLGRANGDNITVRVGDRTQQLVLRSSDVADAGALVITSQTMDRLAPDAPVTAAWATTRPGADAASVMSGLHSIADDHPGLEVGGSLQEIAAISAVLTGLLQIATALTAVAVVIALVGMGNSLSLSVIERGRESALLRALGLQRRQLRQMLAAEAVLLALIGAVVGVLVGIGFGMLGAAAMAAEGGFAETKLAVPITSTVAVIVVAVLAGALASVLPGRRAARAHPVEALAEV